MRLTPLPSGDRVFMAQTYRRFDIIDDTRRSWGTGAGSDIKVDPSGKGNLAPLFPALAASLLQFIIRVAHVSAKLRQRRGSDYDRCFPFPLSRIEKSALH